MNLVHLTTPDDPRLAPYANMRDAELAQRADPLDPAAHAGLFIAEGELVVRRLVASRFRTASVLTTPARLATLGPALEVLPEDVPVLLVPQAIMDGIVGFNMHRGVLAVGVRGPGLTPDDVLARPGPWLVLEDLTNHDNLGGLFRNAAGLGGPGVGVLLSPRCADPLYRKSLRVSMGTVLSVPFARLDGWPGVLADVEARGVETWALTPGAGAEPIGRAAAATRGKVALVLGAEGPGLSADALTACTRRVTIPMRRASAEVDSLNVGMAGGIALYALAAAAEARVAAGPGG